jgi:hypothetical protein
MITGSDKSNVFRLVFVFSFNKHANVDRELNENPLPSARCFESVRFRGGNVRYGITNECETPTSNQVIKEEYVILSVTTGFAQVRSQTWISSDGLDWILQRLW